MKIKRIEIKIESDAEYNKRIDSYIHQATKSVNKKIANESLSISSIAELKNILTEKRIQILHIIREKNPPSIYELAKILNRRQENVHSDVMLLSNLGLITINKEKEGRKKSSLEVKYDTLGINIAIAG